MRVKLKKTITILSISDKFEDDNNRDCLHQVSNLSARSELPWIVLRIFSRKLMRMPLDSRGRVPGFGSAPNND